MPAWDSWITKLRDATGEDIDDIVDDFAMHVLGSQPDSTATGAAAEALKMARSDLSLRSAAAVLVYVADDADDDAAEQLDLAFVSRRDHPFLGPSLLLSLGMFALRNPFARASILRHLLRLKSSDQRPLLVAGAKACGLLCDREDTSVLRSRLGLLGDCVDPAVRAEGLFQIAMLRFSDAMKSETHESLIASLKAAAESFRQAELAEEFRPDARIFSLLIDATLEFDALAIDRSGATETIGRIVGKMRQMGREGYGQIYAMNRGESGTQLADRCIAVASSLHSAATEIRDVVRWTNFDKSVVTLAQCYGVIRHQPLAFAGNAEAVNAFSRISDRVFTPRLSPFLARKVGRESLAEVVRKYELAFGRDGASSGLMALQEATIEAERTSGPKLSADTLACLAFMAQRAGSSLDDFVDNLGVLISAERGDAASAGRLLVSLTKGPRRMPLPTVGVIVALDVEFDAMRLMLRNEEPYRAPGSGGAREYSIGDIPSLRGGIHQVVLAQSMAMGNNASALRAAKMLQDFDGLDCVIMCGIAGGVPHPKSPEDHVRLGDIVVTDRIGVIQYDLGKQMPDGFDHRHDPRPPSARMLEAVKMLERNKLGGSRPWVDHLKAGLAARGYERPDPSTDLILDEDGNRVDHPLVPEPSPRVFLGPIASSNAVQGDFKKRDLLRDKFKVKAVEMEGSGVADAAWEFERVGYFEVRGICDYCDVRTKPTQTDTWKKYAAMVAAAYVRSLLEVLPGG